MPPGAPTSRRSKPTSNRSTSPASVSFFRRSASSFSKALSAFQIGLARKRQRESAPRSGAVLQPAHRLVVRRAAHSGHRRRAPDRASRPRRVSVCSTCRPTTSRGVRETTSRPRACLTISRALPAVAGFYFGREAAGSADFNRVGGFDVRLRPRQTLEVEGFAMRSATAQATATGRDARACGSTRAGIARVLGLLHIGDDFRHDLGFRPAARHRHGVR